MTSPAANAARPSAPRWPRWAPHAARRELAPNGLDTRKLRAHLLLLDCRYPQAEQEARRCLRAEPNNVRLWYFLARSYRGLGRTAEAVAWADRVVATGLDFPPGLQLR